jgi:hypothetical protein
MTIRDGGHFRPFRVQEIPITLSYYWQVGPACKICCAVIHLASVSAIGGSPVSAAFLLTIHETALQNLRKINGGRHHIPQGARDPRFACSSGPLSRPS